MTRRVSSLLESRQTHELRHAKHMNASHCTYNVTGVQLPANLKARLRNAQDMLLLKFAEENVMEMLVCVCLCVCLCVCV